MLKQKLLPIIVTGHFPICMSTNEECGLLHKTIDS